MFVWPIQALYILTCDVFLEELSSLSLSFSSRTMSTVSNKA